MGRRLYTELQSRLRVVPEGTTDNYGLAASGFFLSFASKLIMKGKDVYASFRLVLIPIVASRSILALRMILNFWA